MRTVLNGLALSVLVVTAMPALSQPSSDTGTRCDGSIQVSHLAPPRRDSLTQYRLYVRGSGVSARYYAFGILPGDAYSAHAEQLVMKQLGIDPARRVGDTYAAMEDAENAAREHCRAAQSVR